MDISKMTQETLIKLFKENKRFDGRKTDELQDFEVSLGVSNKAEGTARVKLGKTEVIVGVKMDVGTPYPDSKDKGNLVVSGDLLPLASPRFEMGPPGFAAIELPRLIDRMVRESKMIDLKKLCIKEGEKVWTVYIDIYPINDDGSLLDAAGIGTLVALKNTFIPGLDEDGRSDYHNRTKNKIPLNDIDPVSFTFYKVGDSLYLHPTREEEEAAEAKVTWGISRYGKDYVINSCQKGFETTFSSKEIAKMMELIPQKYEEVIKKLKKHL